MKTIELEDVSKLLDKEWLSENIELFATNRSPTHIKLLKSNKWYCFDEQKFNIEELIFNEVEIYSYRICDNLDYIFSNDGNVIDNGFPVFAPTITELKTKLLIDIRNRIDEIDIEKKELLNRTEDICEL